MKTHTVALVGRPNVGKSTLFNKLIGQRKSLVADQPGVTRDRIFAPLTHNGFSFFLCDTGGYTLHAEDVLQKHLVEQTEVAMEMADCVVLLVDGRAGCDPLDHTLAKHFHRSRKPFIVCINKLDRTETWDDLSAFRSLGANTLLPISAEHHLGFDALCDAMTGVLAQQGAKPLVDITPEALKTPDENSSVETPTISLAILGRPNVGKSSLLNRLLGETRSLVDATPGTTRDCIDAEIRSHGHKWLLVDTAGIRRKSRRTDFLEHISVLLSLQRMELSHVVVLMIDASEGPTEGDARVAGYAFEMRKPIVIVVNKWDLIKDKTHKTTRQFEDSLRMALRYIPYAPILFISTLENLKIRTILPKCLELYQQSRQRFSTSQINKVLQIVTTQHTAPSTKSAKHIKFYYGTQVSVLPPQFVIFCSHPDQLHFSYKRYMENTFREELGLKNIPLSLIYRSSHTKTSHTSTS